MYFNGRVCDILRLVEKAEQEDPSLKEKLSPINDALLSLRASLDYYDGQGTKELGIPYFTKPSPEEDESEFDKELINKIDFK